MASYEIENIKKAIRVILDENEDTNALFNLSDPDMSAADPDTLQTDVITEAMIVRAVDLVNMVAPISMLSDVMKLLSDDAANLFLSDDYCSRIALPVNTLRLTSAKADSWSKPVTEFLQEEDDEYLQLRSKFAGVRASIEMPKAAVTINTENGGLMLEAYPVIPTGKKLYVRYITKAAIANGKVDNIDIKCYDAILYMTANLYYTTLDETKRAEAMEQQVYKMLGLPITNTR